MKHVDDKVRNNNVKENVDRRRHGYRETAQKRHQKKLRSRASKWVYQRAYINAPVIFDLTDSKNRAKVTAFLKKLRMYVDQRKRRIHICFGATKTMGSCGTLLFVSELNRLLALTLLKKIDIRITCGYPRDKIVEQVLQKVGVFKMLGKKKRIDPSNFHETVRYWYTTEGNRVDGEQASDILSPFDGRMAPALSRALYKGVTEALTNCVAHAYTESRDGELPPKDTSLKKWWMFSQEKDGWLTVCICDLGIGIPRSFSSKTSGFFPAVKAWIADTLGRPHVTDAVLIKAAAEMGASVTKLPYRGKGLAQIIDTITGFSGDMVIFSNKGCYRYSAADGKKKTKNYKDSILGTLIVWSAPIREEKTQDGQRNDN